MRALPPVATSDIDHILSNGENDWLRLRGERLFITGATGFFGTWLMEAIVAANNRLATNITVWILSRDPMAFALRSPHLANAKGIYWVTGDVTDFVFPEGTFTHLIHMATAASAQLNETHPEEMLSTIIRGTERVLEFAESHGTQRFLLTSSGAVYGQQPANIKTIPETYPAPPKDHLSPRSAYAEGKRQAELQCTLAAERSGIETKIARCFAFVGPHLALDTHFAIGNFIGDVLEQREIHVRSDGTALRSYLYAADLVIWLIRILLDGHNCSSYNVGSEEPISINNLAHLVASTESPSRSIKTNPPKITGKPPQAYIPNTDRAKKELGLSTLISLPDSIQRTIAWHKARLLK